MDEVIRFSDWVRVLNKGKLTAVKKTPETNPTELARLMVGREVLFNIEKQEFKPGGTVLEIQNATVKSAEGLNALDDVSLTIRQGEVLGIAGVAGNGQVELTEIITGLRTTDSGTRAAQRQGPDQQFANQDDKIRRQSYTVRPCRDGNSRRYERGKQPGNEGVPREAYSEGRGLLRTSRILDFARKMISAFKISTPSTQTHVKFLSGGNIQKTILAREIDACGDLLVAAYPSRGLDVGATEAIRTEIVQQRDSGRAVMLVSEDLDELFSISDE